MRFLLKRGFVLDHFFLASQVFPSRAMDSHDYEKKVEAITSVEVVPDLDKTASTTAEKISAHFTIAAAAFGLISDGCESPCMTVPNARLD